ncbi:MAG: alpha/beta fold hydrolase [Gracilimonas sp.]
MKLLSLVSILIFSTLSGSAQSVLEYPFETKHADLQNGATVSYIEAGSGDQTLILIHGLGSYLPAWSMNIDELSQHFKVIALDLPGYGQSSKDTEQHTIPFFAESVEQLMNELQIERTSLIGHSMGGQIALYISAHSPEKIEKLVLSAPAGFEQFTEQHKAAFAATVSPEAIAAATDSMIAQNMNVNFVEFPESAQFIIDDRIALKQSEDFDDYARAQSESVFAMLNEPVWDLLSEIEQPTLVIYGNQDALIPNRYLNPQLTTKTVAEAGVERMPNADLQMIDQAGHFVHFEQAEIFNQAVIEFLNN